LKSFINASFVILAISLLTAGAYAQQASNPPFDFPDHTTPEPPERQNNDRIVSREDRVLKKGLLAPTAQDRTDHSAFLKESNTGLVRLLPYQRTNERLVRGGGAYYSFHYISHEYGIGSDIELVRPVIITSRSVPRRVLEGTHDMLSVGFAGADYGMLTNLGEVPLNEITAKDPRAHFLAKYEPPRSDPDARCERRRFVVGEKIDGLVYKNSLPVRVGATYLLRSINYNESDVLVAFRVARQDDEGSIIIAWKLLKDFAPRKLENINVKSKCSGPIVIKSP
jgi:hypothetical protein